MFDPVISVQHPSFCDPRVCAHVGVENVDHRSTPFELRSSVDDYLLSAGLARFDSIDPELGYVGPATARLSLRDLASDNPDGTERVIGSDLTAADARLLAAALVCVAEQLEDLQRGQVAAR